MTTDTTRDELYKKASEIHRRISQHIDDKLPNQIKYR